MCLNVDGIIEAKLSAVYWEIERRSTTGRRGTPHRPIFLTCMDPTLESAAILMKFTHNVWMNEKRSWTKIFWNLTGGRGTPHTPVFLTCTEPTLESAAILMKFTQDMCVDEKTSWKKHFWNRTGGWDTPHRPTALDSQIAQIFFPIRILFNFCYYSFNRKSCM